MIFTPNTWVKLLSNVPLDSNYTHTLSFSSKAEQSTYFSSLAVKSYDHFSYQRFDPKRGKIAAIRVPEVADNLYNVNYVMFRNNNFSDKWFYAFVKEINFINDHMTEIIYEIDVLQTWYFDYKIQDSFVVREHVNDDTLYKHFIEEDLDTGEYIVGNYGYYNGFQPQNCYTVVAASFGLEDAPDPSTGYIDMRGGTLGYLYNQLTYYAFDKDENVQKFIDACTKLAIAQGIVSIFPYPKAMWPNSISTEDGVKPAIQTVFDKAQQLKTFGSYTPHNNKLYCYPYSFIYVTNNNGTSAEYRYEYFTGRMAFAVCSNLSCAPDFFMCPMNYKQANNPGFSWQEGMSSGPLPYCSWITDTYKAYLAQNQSRLGAQRTGILTGYATNAIRNVVGMFTNMSLEKVGNSIMNEAINLIDTAQNVINYQAEQKDRQKQPPQSNAVSGNETGFSLNLRNFGFYNMQITETYARMIDKFFDMYGYKVNTVKKPNITGRKSWNYVKTANVQIIGNMPADDLALICRIFDTGITFWHSKDVGNYSLDNSIKK